MATIAKLKELVDAANVEFGEVSDASAAQQREIDKLAQAKEAAAAQQAAVDAAADAVTRERQEALESLRAVAGEVDRLIQSLQVGAPPA